MVSAAYSKGKTTYCTFTEVNSLKNSEKLDSMILTIISFQIKWPNFDKISPDKLHFKANNFFLKLPSS